MIKDACEEGIQDKSNMTGILLISTERTENEKVKVQLRHKDGLEARCMASSHIKLSFQLFRCKTTEKIQIWALFSVLSAVVGRMTQLVSFLF